MLELPEAKQCFHRTTFFPYLLSHSIFYQFLLSFFPQIIINHIIYAGKWLVGKSNGEILKKDPTFMEF